MIQMSVSAPFGNPDFHRNFTPNYSHYCINGMTLGDSTTWNYIAIFDSGLQYLQTLEGMKRELRIFTVICLMLINNNNNIIIKFYGNCYAATSSIKIFFLEITKCVK